MLPDSGDGAGHTKTSLHEVDEDILLRGAADGTRPSVQPPIMFVPKELW